LFRSPGRVGTGVVYDALVGFGPAAEPIFTTALGSELESVRVAACFGIAALSEPEDARRSLEPLLDDPSPRVRSAAASSLGQIGGESLPEGLARATQDEASAVRAAATRALGAYDDPRAVEVAVAALSDSERDTAVRAGEALVRLSGGRNAGPAASQALERTAQEWPVERALIYASLGAA
jgi:HEAT repeat protein